ncbi:hypothetical protein FOA52_000307 [Chlamydomonas sp. UWO 241]|nr:hypothetical protein FOA52_000307 [Chlamydomonas sp. UWO 241]
MSVAEAGCCSQQLPLSAASSTEWYPWTASFTFRMKAFSPLATNEPVYSDGFDAGIATWRLKVYHQRTHLSVFLVAQDAICAPGGRGTFESVTNSWRRAFAELGDSQAGWHDKDDCLVLTVDVTVQREDRFQLDAGASTLRP